MYRRIEDFLRNWEYEAASTSKVIGALLDRSVADRHRTLRRLAWHLAQSIPEMMNLTGLSISGVDPRAPVPGNLAEIKKAYDGTSASLAREVKSQWNDKSLDIEDNMFGQNWKRGITLTALLMHQAHHRGQMTVLMRQAGLKVPGVYGPALEEWADHGHPAPEV